jgi:hypothetical protein
VNKYLYIITEGEEEEVVYRYDVSYLYQHLRQKKYFASGAGTEREEHVAEVVEYAFNEYL